MGRTFFLGIVGCFCTVALLRRPVVCETFTRPKAISVVSYVFDFDMDLLVLNFRILSLL